MRFIASHEHQTAGFTKNSVVTPIFFVPALQEEAKPVMVVRMPRKFYSVRIIRFRHSESRRLTDLEDVRLGKTIGTATACGFSRYVLQDVVLISDRRGFHRSVSHP